MAAPQQLTQLMLEYPQDLLDCYARCQAKYAEVDNGFADMKALKTETWDEDDDEGLEKFLTGLDTESDACYQKVNEVQSNHMKTFERCMTLLTPTTPHTLKETQATAPSITDLKLLFLDIHNVLGKSNGTPGEDPTEGEINSETEDGKGQILHCKKCDYKTEKFKQGAAKTECSCI